ncbi:MAG: hypothetical protein SPL18_08180 [Oscillospiraceae bacterium]|nr:hypothetical protein [Oscillospiraceae bacterium]
MRPHVAGVVIQFVRDGGEVNGIIVTEETVSPSRSALGRRAMYLA